MRPEPSVNRIRICIDDILMPVGRPARIDRDAVLATGLVIADELGLEALTMGAVAERLGVTPMALYRHVVNKADLLDGIVELLLTEFPAPTVDDPVSYTHLDVYKRQGVPVGART